jgi:hypothetical protein
MSDSEFYKAFKENMDMMGLPCPASLFGTLAAATGTISALASAVKTYGTGLSLIDAFRYFPTAASSITTKAAAVSEITTGIGAVAASFYVGACVGSLIMAAVQVYGPNAYGKVSGLLGKVADALDTSIGDLIETTLRKHPQAAPIRPAVVKSGQVTPRRAK